MADDLSPLTRERSPPRTVHRALARPRTLWALAVLAMALDVAITGVGLSLGFRERNPLARAFIEAGGLLAAGVALKGGSLAVGYGCWRLLPWLAPAATRYRYVVPLGLALPSWVAVGINAALVLPGL